jgi:hypothetical protein
VLPNGARKIHAINQGQNLRSNSHPLP